MLRGFVGRTNSTGLMSDSHTQNFLIFLRMMSKKGFYNILNYVDGQGNVQYNHVLKYAMVKKIVESEASVTIILNGLTNLGLLDRSVINSRPVRTNYSVSKNGYNIIKNFKELESFF
jgi:DNA-binding HxlR family transcriptional regulator